LISLDYQVPDLHAPGMKILLMIVVVQSPRVLASALYVILSLALSTAAGAQDRPAVSGEAGRRLDGYLSRLEPFCFAGGALAVRGKEVLLCKSCGLAECGRRRRILHFKVTEYPTGRWIGQQLRETLRESCQYRYAILDRDGKFGGEAMARMRLARFCDACGRDALAAWFFCTKRR
jgi:hypothetical protein